MRYYRITFLDVETDIWGLAVPWKQDGAAIDVWSYVSCRQGQRQPKPIIEVEYAGQRTEFSLGRYGVPIASKRVAALLAEIAGDDFESIPATIENNEECEIINVLSCVDAIDRYHSWVSYNPIPYVTEPEKAGTIMNVEKLVLDPSKIGGQHLFRLADWHVDLVASEEIVEALSAAGATNGVRCQEIPTESSAPGRMQIYRRGKMVPWSIEEREQWLRTRDSGEADRGTCQ